MHLTIYVHDFHPQIGHSRAMQELLNGLSVDQKASIISLEVVAFTSTDLNLMFSEFNCSKHFTKIPFPHLKPFLIKMFFYHLITFFHSLTFGLRTTKIGIGISCLNVDIVNVQFIHEQWNKLFFKNKNLSLLAKTYKKILFLYFSFAEKYMYSKNKKIQYLLIANFLKKFLHEEFKTSMSNMTLIPSGVNTKEFNLLEISTDELATKLITSYPQLSNLDQNGPIALFIGAFERKGLERAISALENSPNAQLIVIGKSENSNFEMPNVPFKIIHIPFTKEVSLFYQLADLFIFPTSYEPFGLVIIEAYVMGLDLLIPIENVGASEIIPNGDGIHFFHQNEKITTPKLTKITFSEKSKRRKERLQQIEQFSWRKNGSTFYSVLLKSQGISL